MKTVETSARAPRGPRADASDLDVTISLRTNMFSLSMLRHLETSRLDLDRTTRRISSGLRIQRAADDPAGLAISDQLRNRVRLYEQGGRNVGDGLSLGDIADGALDEISTILDRLRELASQAGTDLVTDAQRGSLAAEFDALKAEIERIAQTTTFNGRTLLDGSLAVADATSLDPAVVRGSVAQAGVLAQAETITFEDFGLFAGLSAEQRQIQLSAGQNQFNLALDINNNPVIGALVRASAYQGRLEISSYATGTAAQFLVSSDIEASSSSTGLGTTMLHGLGTDSKAATEGIAVQAGIEGGADDRIVLDIADARLEQIGLVPARIDNVANARSTIEVLDQVSAKLQTARAKIGASMNRLETTAESLRTARQNTAAAASRIRDADIAETTTQFVRAQILQSIGASLLAQANVVPQSALALIASTTPQPQAQES